MDKPKYNASGCKDMTVFYAIENVSREEKKRADEERVKKLLKSIFRETEKAGFHLENRLILRDKKTGKVWR